ncbi:endonuclease III [Patescibacteria group bacterium]|nr:endonuclease III [Patescibacteria group bacterium]
MSHSRISIGHILKELERIYDPPKSFIDWKTPLDLLVATILSAQCTDVRVNIVTKKLFKLCRTAEDYRDIPRVELEKLIHSCGTFRRKAKHIQGLSHILINEYKGEVPQTMEGLVELLGVGRKTAAIILYAAFEKLEGIAVDTHVMRLAQRLGLSQHKTPEKIEKDLMKIVPKEQWGRLNTLLISHGRAVCTARNRKCGQCVFMDTCPSSQARGKKDLAQER